MTFLAIGKDCHSRHIIQHYLGSGIHLLNIRVLFLEIETNFVSMLVRFSWCVRLRGTKRLGVMITTKTPRSIMKHTSISDMAGLPYNPMVFHHYGWELV